MHPLLRNVLQFVVAGVILALALAAHSPYAKSIATVWESYEQPKLGFSLGSSSRENAASRLRLVSLERRRRQGLGQMRPAP